MATEAKTTETKAGEATGAVVTTAKITVTKAFRDKFNTKIRYEVGKELEFDVERAADAVARELAQYVDPIV